MYNYVSIEGNIGSGKTTLAMLLAEDMGAFLLLEEFEDNPFLPLFYKEKEKYGLHVELSFLVDRYHQLRNFTKSNLFGTPTISDYYLIKCLLFAKNNLSETEYHLFESFFGIVKDNTPTPDLIIYLDAPVPHLQQNIHSRNRSYEQDISDAYLADISAQYHTFIRSTEIPTLRVDATRYDFVTDVVIRQKISDIILSGQLQTSVL